MANSWLRLWHELPNDPKWRVIARSSGQPIPSVISVYLHLLVSASQNEKRGVTQYNAEDIAASLDLETKSVEAIVESMQGRVLDESRITGWEKRQPIREDFSTERVKKWRERNVTQRNAPDKDKDQEKIKKKQKTPAPGKPSAECLTLYQAYPRHIAPAAAYRAIGKALQVKPFDYLIAAVNRYAKSVQATDPQYIAHPATWFNAGRYDDEPSALFPSGGKSNVGSSKNQPSPAKQRIDGARRVLAEIAISRGLYDPAGADGRPDAPVPQPRPAGERG